MRFLTLKTFGDGHLTTIHKEKKEAEAVERREAKAAQKEAERAKKKADKENSK